MVAKSVYGEFWCVCVCVTEQIVEQRFELSMRPHDDSCNHKDILLIITAIYPTKSAHDLFCFVLKVELHGVTQAYVSVRDDLDGLVQERRNSSALSMELRFSLH